MKKMLAAAVSMILTGVACAQAPAAPAPPATMMHASVAAGTAIEHHISELHGQLQITAGEEAQWSVVAAAMRDGAVRTDTAIDRRKVLGEGASAVDSLSAYAEIAQAHADGVKQLAVAFAALYAAMPADQQRVADTVFAHHPHKGRKSA